MYKNKNMRYYISDYNILKMENNSDAQQQFQR